MMPSFTKFKDPKYEKVDDDHAEESSRSSDEVIKLSFLESLRPQKTRRNWILIGICFALSLLVAVLIAQLVLVSKGQKLWLHMSWNNNQGSIKAPCGATAAEARARGCHYSWALGSWLSDECFEPTLEERFTKNYKFEYYYAKNASAVPPEVDLDNPIKTPEELSEVPAHVPTFSTWRYHFQHCSACWHYIHRAGMYGKRISAQLAPEAHTHHCMGIMLDHKLDPDYMGTTAFNTFPDCVRMSDYKSDSLTY